MKTMRIGVLMVLSMIGSFTYAQTTHGEIQGRVFDRPGLPNMDAIVWVMLNGEPFKTQVDDEGRFVLKPLNPGSYQLSITTSEINDTIHYLYNVLPNEITRTKDVIISELDLATTLDDVFIMADPLIRVDQPAVIKMDAKQLKNLPVKRDLKQVMAVMTTDVKVDGNGDAYVRGSRADAVVYFIDGVKQSDKLTYPPSSAINNVMVYTGGVPAKYGDCLGGVVIVETKSYSSLYYEWLANH